jgi:hypothetical protein
MIQNKKLKMKNKYLKISDFAKLNRNKSNNQFSLNLKSKVLKKKGIRPEQLLNMKIPLKLNLDIKKRR